MCGIAGFLAPDVARPALEDALTRLAHRGPDEHGIYVGKGVGLAASRLSIIDLAGGKQPISNEDGTVWVVFNGEIVNAPELRNILLNAGHHFQTGSDTEVLVHAYEEWGVEFISRLRGMFAFALWDGNHTRLLLVRDRFGIKPLYYAQRGTRFAFASEIKGIFAVLPDLPREADRESLWRLFETKHIPGPHTAFKGIFSLPSAHWMLIEDGVQEIKPYWSLEFPPISEIEPLPPTEAADQFLDKLRPAVDAWRLSDVPVGSLLSGGIDSATVAALLTELHGEPIHTFTIAFDAEWYDEADAARQTAKEIGSIHHELRFAGHSYDLWPEIIQHLENPLCPATCIPLAMLYKACRAEGFKVIMTGEGADEMLGGYQWFNGDRRVRPYLRLPGVIRRKIASQAKNISPGARQVLRFGGKDPIERYLLWHTYTQASLRSELILSEGPSIASEWEERYFNGLKGLHPFHQFVSIESKTRMTDYINFQVDRMSMMSSVEARPPFMDHYLWEFCARLPPRYNLNGRGHKMLLRQAMRALGVLSPTIQQRSKKGLAAPHHRWWRSGRLPDWAEERITPAALKRTGYFDPATFARIRAAHQKRLHNNGLLLTGVLTTQLWDELVLKTV